MIKKIIAVCFGSIICLLLVALAVPAVCQQNSATQPTVQNQPADNQESPAELTPPGHVVIEGYPVLTVYETVLGRSPQDRARGIEQRIITAAKDHALSTSDLRVENREAWAEIHIGDEPIMAVTQADAEMAGGTRDKIAADYTASIAQAIQHYRQEHSWPTILGGVARAAVTTLVLVVLLWLVRRVRFVARARIERRIQRSANLQKKSAWQISVAYFGPILLGAGAILRWLFILALIEAYLTVTLGFFSSTRELSLQVTRWVFSQLSFLGESALGYLPSLIVVGVVALFTYYLFRLIGLIFGEIAKGNLKIRGFYSDWAEPTEKLVRMLVLVLAVIVAFPYLPGAKSPAFQGISIFLGVLLSLGSSSAVANAIAGIILTYMRSFLLGDWVQIGDTTGEVVEKNLLVTRVLTPKAEIITIPNATVMSGAVKNYSVEARKAGVVFYTTVTIGYDASWRTVHQLLVNSALATKYVLPQPAPFVLQKALNDFYVAYELNAYTDAPREMLNIYSDLHQNIQDKFNEAGVEICSPHFSALRDGNTIAVPDGYVPPGYKGPAFRLKIMATENNSEVVPNSRSDSPKTP